MADVINELNQSAEAQQSCNCACVSRRAVLRGVAGVAGLAGLSSVSSVFGQDAPEAMRPQPGDFIVSANGTTPLTPADVRLNANPFDAWAMSPDGIVRNGDFDNSLMLLRYEPDTLPEETKARAGEGVLAFNVICTHAGCPVSSELEGPLIKCDCHGSRFDPTKNGEVAHGPARRKLPQLSLTVVDGKLSVASEFDSRIGGDMVGEDDR
ncbi:MAG: hypothetical protein JWR75_230 [Devosia sp.]|nr:hypothetical protein [Devosia sp.]